MGGWASYKLAFEHPDDFAGALVLDGPVICGVEAYPGLNGPAYSDPACSQDGQSQPLDRQRAVDSVRDRSDLRRRAGPHHRRDRPGPDVRSRSASATTCSSTPAATTCVYATEDRFGDAVAGSASRCGPSIPATSPTAGTRASTTPRSASAPPATTGSPASRPGTGRSATIATVHAADAALPEPAGDRRSASARRWSPSRCPGPRPGSAGSSARRPAARETNDPAADRRRRR